MGIDVLFLNAILYIVTTIYFYYKYRTLSLYVVIWIAYSIVAFMGYYTVVMDIHYSHDPQLGYKVPLEPYIYCYLTIFLLTYPFKKMDIGKMNFGLLNDVSFVKNGMTFLSMIFFLRLIFAVMTFIVVMQTIGVGNAYLFSHEGGGYITSYSPVASKVLWISGLIKDTFFPLFIVYYFQRIVNSIGKTSFNILCIAVAFLPEIILSIAHGSKGQLFFVAFEFVFYYFLFRRSLSNKIRHMFSVIAGIMAIFMLCWVFIITVSRIDAMGADVEESDQILRYLGEPYPNLCWVYYGNVKQHPNGRRFFPEFFSPNPEKLYGEGMDGKFAYWEPKTQVNMAYLKTFWGDWYVEFGYIGSFVGIILLYVICRRLFLKKYWLLSNFSLVAFYYSRIVIQGCFTGAGFEGSSRHRVILSLLLLGFLIKMGVKDEESDSTGIV